MCSQSEPNWGSSSGIGASAPPKRARRPGCADVGKPPPPAAVSGGPSRVEEWRGIDADNPTVAVGRDVRVDIEVVAHGVLADKSVEIGCDFEMGCRLVFSGPAIH